MNPFARPPYLLHLLSIVAVAACGPRDAAVHHEDLELCPASSLPQPGRCVPPGIHTFFDMPHNDMPAAGMSAGALDRNHALLTALAGSALTTELLSDGVLQKLLLEPYAPELASYVVSCALDPCDTIEIPSTPELATISAAFGGWLRGELGLCGERFAEASGSSEGPWRGGHPSQGCLERVSACVLARTNALGSKVVFSMRGEGSVLQPRVPTQTQFREHDGTAIASFGGCDAACLFGDRLKRNCDWEPRYVGQCEARTRVKLATVAPTANVRLRVCAGIYGCDSYGTRAGPTTVPGTSLPRYGGVVIADAAASTVEFSCPDNGPFAPDGTQTGYYAIMVGSLRTTALPPGTDVQRVDPTGHPLGDTSSDSYPAPESAVFTYREGAFYGTLFDSQPAPPPNGLNALLGGNQYACYSDGWSDGAATLTHRLCAGPLTPGTSCFVNPPAPCDDTANPGRCRPQPPAPTPRVADECDGLNAASNTIATWRHPYTSFLNHPCDLFASDEDCLGSIDPNRYPWIVVRPQPPVPQL